MRSFGIKMVGFLPQEDSSDFYIYRPQVGEDHFCYVGCFLINLAFFLSC